MAVVLHFYLHRKFPSKELSFLHLLVKTSPHKSNIQHQLLRKLSLSCIFRLHANIFRVIFNVKFTASREVFIIIVQRITRPLQKGKNLIWRPILCRAMGPQSRPNYWVFVLKIKIIMFYSSSFDLKASLRPKLFTNFHNSI